MSNSDKISNTKLNKHCDLSRIKSKLVILIQELFAVGFFSAYNRKELTNTLFQQVNVNHPVVSIQTACFQNDENILQLTKYLLEEEGEERVESLRRTIIRPFKHELSDGIVPIDYSNPIFNQGGEFYKS